MFDICSDLITRICPQPRRMLPGDGCVGGRPGERGQGLAGAWEEGAN